MRGTGLGYSPQTCLYYCGNIAIVMALFFRLVRASVAVALVAACGGSDGAGSLFGDGRSIVTGPDGGAASSTGGVSNSGGATTSSGGSINAAGGLASGNGGTGALAGGAGSAGLLPDAAVGGDGAAGSDAQGVSPCPSGQGQKFCEGLCVAPTPQVGCSAVDCVPCPAPPMDAVSVCIAEQCDFECTPGFVRSGVGCVPAPCDPATCPACPNGGVPCCTTAGQCACRTAWNPFCG